MRRHLAVIVAAVLLAHPALAVAVRTSGLSQGQTDAQYHRLDGTTVGKLLIDATQTACSAALSIAYNGDTDTGVQRAAANTLALCIGGAAGLTLASAGSTLATPLTLTGALTISGVTTDITAASGEDLVVSGGATSGSVVLQSNDNITEIKDSGGTVRARWAVGSSADVYVIQAGASGNEGVVRASSTTGFIGFAGNAASSAAAGCVGDSLTTSGGTTLFCVYGEGVYAPAGGAAIALTTATDTTTAPLGGSSGCRISTNQAGGTAWTPSETGAVDKMLIGCTNTGSNTITMTESSGVYEGGAVPCALGQWDVVTFEYVTDRWVERSCKDNRRAPRRRRVHRAFRMAQQRAA